MFHIHENNHIGIILGFTGNKHRWIARVKWVKHIEGYATWCESVSCAIQKVYNTYKVSYWCAFKHNARANMHTIARKPFLGNRGLNAFTYSRFMDKGVWAV
jgi:hypothetical protein